MDIVRLHYSTIDSTNTWAKKHAEELDPSVLTVVTADTQTAGRGQFDRKWVSPPGDNVYASFIFYLERLHKEVPKLSQVLAISVASVLQQMGFSPGLKWPNDVLLNEKKVAGVLIETTPVEAGIAVIGGVGINVNMPAEALSAIDQPATSLLVEDGQSREVEEVIKLLVKRFSGDLEQFLKATYGE